jgi:cellulose synthase/poly-beta-1,6-N-acetylglucosamine synthase-like glycosyltransferase
VDAAESPSPTMFDKHGSVTLIVALVLAPFVVLTFCFAVEVLVGLRRLRLPHAPQSGPARAVIIVPAHDEEAILAGRLSDLKESIAGRYRILLVADNCTDSTANIARRLQVEVIERSDTERRGKGYALDFARRHLQDNPPDVVVIVDADCEMDRQSVERLVEGCAALASPCQATNLQSPAPNGSPAVQLSTFAFFIKNVIRQRALQRLAGRAHLLGTGMAFPWPIFDRAALASGNIVEDLKLGQELAITGHAPAFVEEATVWSNAETDGNTLSQRSRWEGGFLQNALRSGPAMFGTSLMAGDGRSLWAAINVMIPPLALLILMDVALLLLGAVLVATTGARPWPLLVLGGSLVLAGLSLTLAWASGGSRFVSLGGLARVPLYILWKLPMYFGFARGGAPKDWVRTGRDER